MMPAPKSLADLVLPAAIDAIGDPSPLGLSFAFTTTREDLKLLRKWCESELKKDLSAERHANLAEAKFLLKGVIKANPIPAELCVATIRRLLPFDSLAAYRRFTDALDQIVLGLSEKSNRKRDLPRVAAALACRLSMIKLRRPLRIAPLAFTGAERVVDGQVRPRLSDGAEAELGPGVLALLDHYFFTAEKLIGRPPLYLAEKVAGGMRTQSALGHDVRDLLDSLGYDLRFDEVNLLGIKYLIDLGKSYQTIADAAGYRCTVNFTRRFGPLLRKDAAVIADLALIKKLKGSDGEAECRP